MLPDVRWVVAGLLATVILVLGGMGLTARLRNAHDLAATPLQIAPAEQPWKQAAVSTDQRVIVDVPQRIPTSTSPAPAAADSEPEALASELSIATGAAETLIAPAQPAVQDTQEALGSEVRASVLPEPQSPASSDDDTSAAEVPTGSITPAADIAEPGAGTNEPEPLAAAVSPDEPAETSAVAEQHAEAPSTALEQDHARFEETEDHPRSEETEQKVDPNSTADPGATVAAVPASDPATDATPAVTSSDTTSQPAPPATIATASTPAASTDSADGHAQAPAAADASKAAALAKRKARQRRLRRLRAAQQAQQQAAAAQQQLNPFIDLFGPPPNSQPAPPARPTTSPSAPAQTRR
jgi:S-DNA-T family DNA segregation ATPase FtsK/SpoIIIE